MSQNPIAKLAEATQSEQAAALAAWCSSAQSNQILDYTIICQKANGVMRFSPCGALS